MTSGYAELEIGLQRGEAGAYRVDFRFSQPDSDADIRLGQGLEPQVSFNLNRLQTLTLDPDAYGQQLSQDLFSSPDIQKAFAQAWTAAQSLQVPLRLRLFISPSAAELHSLHWETLRDPQDGAPLCTNENLLFSRYLSSLDWRPVRLQSKRELRAVIVVSNPADLGDYQLAPVDVAGETQRVRESLGDIPLTCLPDPDSNQRATLENLSAMLRASAIDILYLVCHGALVKGEPWLWLEDEQGKTARTSGRELVTRLKELGERPRLIVLASCQSAGKSAGDALAALGPRLAEAGIPAVIAMQGDVSMPTISACMPVFFAELQRDGQIDRALAVARGVVRQRPDYWMPALFMRLRSGRVWYTPGFSGEQPEFEKWESISTAIEEGSCTTISGPGLTEPLIGRGSEIALRWAEKHGYPLVPSDQEDLPRVAQYVVTRQDPTYLRTAFREALRDEILSHNASLLAEELRQRERWSPNELLEALQQVADAYWASTGDNPFQKLARLRLPIYITAMQSDLLKNALIAEGAAPEERLCPWNELIPKSKCIYEDDPSPEKPLVYYLFGHIREPFSLVITEDEFFDYLIGVTVNKELIPEAVRAALTSTALLFLGFRMDDWNFRVLFRMIMGQGGRAMLRLFSHVAAQIEPEEGRIIDARRARRYLEKYFDSEHISLYWGSSQDFLKDLEKHLDAG